MDQTPRPQAAQELRQAAAWIAANRPHPRHRSNGEEYLYRRTEVDGCRVTLDVPSHIANFTKGLPHETEGPRAGLLSNPHDYQQFILGIQSGDRADFAQTPLGPRLPGNIPAGALSQPAITPANIGSTSGVWRSAVARQANDGAGAGLRAWESAGGGLQFDLQGPDAQAVTMPPAPRLDSVEYAAEVAEVYCMALLRDVHVSQLRAPALGPQHAMPAVAGCDCGCEPPLRDVDRASELLCEVRLSPRDQYGCRHEDAQGAGCDGENWFQLDCCALDAEQRARHRSQVDRQHIFRGIAPGDDIGPYVSQFLLVGNDSRGGRFHGPAAGQIEYGAIRIDQWVRVATPCQDYMTTFESWVDVQNGADVAGAIGFCAPHEGPCCGHEPPCPEKCDCRAPASLACRDFPAFRFICTPRDMATYVHYDALYEAYLNACLILLGMGAPFDRGLPFGAPDVVDHQQGFAHFGGPHILSLVTEVATRALKAVRYQKFNTHRRLRPEAVAGLIDRYKQGINPHGELDPVGPLVEALDCAGLLDLVREHNTCQNRHGVNAADPSASGDNYFLPMAFPEGSPMHPAYGAGHATVAGACVTLLKAFFDAGWQLPFRDCHGQAVAYEPNEDGSRLVALPLCQPLTVEGELNKLAANISIARNWAGVHYFTDYIESLRLGEQVALGLLEEQRLGYGENFTMTVPLFDGSVVRI